MDSLQKSSATLSTPISPTSTGPKKRNPLLTILPSQQLQRHIRKRGWKKNGKKNANCGSFGKVSYVESLGTCATRSANSIILN